MIVDDPVPPLSPYRGLNPFAEEDWALFFGRDREIRSVITHLMASRVTVLYGQSGVGKSSLLRAGVVRRLRAMAEHNLAEHGRPEIAVAIFNAWHDEPLERMHDVIETAIKQSLPDQVVSPRIEPDTLVSLIRRWTDAISGELFIVLDQFEEYFLYHPYETGVHTFAEEFVRAVTESDLRVSF